MGPGERDARGETSAPEIGVREGPARPIAAPEIGMPRCGAPESGTPDSGASNGVTPRIRERRPEAFLSPGQLAAARRFVARARAEVPASLAAALLFGSRARRQARPDSDIDVLLVFDRLPPDREPQAGLAEAIAEEVAAETGHPVTVWSVARADLELGRRTPMLVDALADGVPLWARPDLPLAVRFTPWDALRCVGALLDRVDEGGDEVAELRRRGDEAAAAKRSRDDVVRLCTSVILLRGETRPRRADAVARFRALAESLPGGRPLVRRHRAVLDWAARSYGADGRDEDAPLAPPPGGPRAVAAFVADARALVVALGRRLSADVGPLRDPSEG